MHQPAVDAVPPVVDGLGESMCISARILTSVLVTAAFCLAAASSAALTPPFFDQPDAIPVDGLAMSDVAVLDFDGDGYPDIAAVGPQKLELIRGLANGWAEPQRVAIPSDTGWADVHLATGDLTGDNRDDIVLAISDAGKVALVRGRSDGVLSAPADADVYSVTAGDDSSAPHPTTSIDVGDVNGDGSLDVVAAFKGTMAFTASPVVVMTNNGSGTLTSATSVMLDKPQKVLLVELGGDHDPDLVVAQGKAGWEPPPPGEVAHGQLAVAAGGSQATFGTPALIDTGEGAAQDIAAGDFNQDGVADIVVGRGDYGTPALVPRLFPGAANAPAFGSPVDLASSVVPWDVEWQVGATDADRDGRDDVVAGYFQGAGAAVARATGPLAFAADGGVYAWPRQMTAWTPADADGDGKVDFVATAVGPYDPAQVQVYYGRGPVLRPPAYEVDFGTVTVGSSSAPQTGSFVNTGPGTAASLSLVVDGDIADFALDADGCSGASLAEEETCPMTVHFKPTVAGERELDAALVAPDSDVAVWTALFGLGVEPRSPTPPAGSYGGTVSQPPLVAPALAFTRAGPARLTGRGRSMRIDTGWRAACGAGAPPCRLDVLVVARAKRGQKRAPVLARAAVKLAGGTTQRVVIGLTTAGRRALRPRRKVTAVIQISGTRTGTQPVAVHSNAALRATRK
jgi:FG-GAP-like repeat/FG-GAP repeat